jgi:hypothetical protein
VRYEQDIESVPNRGSPPAILLRESYREQGRVKKCTLANLSNWPATLVEGFRTLLKSGVAGAAEGVLIRRSLPHGHAAAVLGTLRAIGLDRLLGKPADKRLAALAIALIASRLISPASKLATARDLAADTAGSSLGWLLQLGAVDEVELYRALDWLGERQAAVEAGLARRHLKNGALALYDVSSSWLEGRCCELARFGYSRDGKKGKLQIVYGLLCAADGCPVAVEVFAGNTADPMTLATQVDKLKQRFGLSRVVLVGDRGMITSARIGEELRPAGLDWITALRAPQIRALLDTGAFQLSLFDERDLAEITAPDFPGERLVVCKNPLLAEQRARKREDLLRATEAAFGQLADKIAHGRDPNGKDKIARAVGRIENRYKLAKHFDIATAEDGFTAHRNPARTVQEARLDGFLSSAPALRIKPWRQMTWSAPTRGWRGSSAPFAASRRSICTSARSITGSLRGCARMSFSACSPVTSNGTCASGSNQSCLMMMTRWPPPVSAPRSSPPNPRHRRIAQARRQTHPRGPTGPQLPKPTARSGHLHAELDDHHSQPGLQLPAGGYPDRGPDPSLRPPRRRSPQLVASKTPHPTGNSLAQSATCVFSK